MSEELKSFTNSLAKRRQDQHDQTLTDTSPVPKGADSQLTRQVLGVITEKIIAPALSRTEEDLNAIENPEARRRAKMIKKWVKNLYNESVRGKYDNWTHAEFESELLASFTTGFNYFAQVASINDINRLRKQPRTVRRIVDGKSTQKTERDERKPVQIISETYATADGGDAIEAYANETLGTFSVMFFKLLKVGLERGTPRKDLLLMLARTYSISEELFEYEKNPAPPFSLDKKTMELVCRQYPAQALKRLDAYRRLGEKLIATYWGDPTPGVQTLGNREWVTSPVMIRNLILRHPDHVERGLAIVDNNLSDIMIRNPGIPKDIVIETCAEYGDKFEEELQQIHADVNEALDLYLCTDLTCDAGAASEGNHVFRFLNMGPRLYQLISRKRKGYVTVLRKAEEVYTRVLESAQQKKIDISFRSKRRIMQLLISGKDTNINRIIKREEERVQKEQRRIDRFIRAAENADPEWGVQYAIWGAGSSLQDVLASGKERITDILRSYYGDNYTEALLDHQFETLDKYFDAGFPPTGPEADRLKECLIISPNSVRKYYEELGVHNNLAWPPDVEEIPYDSSWENTLVDDDDSDNS